MRIWIATLSLAFAMSLTTDALAQCCPSKAKAKPVAQSKETATKTSDCCQPATKDTCCAGSKTGQSAAAAEQCAGQRLVEAGVPVMTYRVGDETTRCPQQAREMAHNDESKIRFVVDDRTFTDKTEADTAYRQFLERHLAGMTTVRYAVGDQCVSCPMAAKSMASSNGEKVEYQVGTFKFVNQSKAQTAARRAREAADGVRLRCMRDGKLQNCDPTACGKAPCTDGNKSKTTTVATGNGKPNCVGTGKCEWVVGDVQTTCEVTAHVALARARIQAAQQAIQQTVGS